MTSPRRVCRGSRPTERRAAPGTSSTSPRAAASSTATAPPGSLSSGSRSAAWAMPAAARPTVTGTPGSPTTAVRRSRSSAPRACARLGRRLQPGQPLPDRDRPGQRRPLRLDPRRPGLRLPPQRERLRQRRPVQRAGREGDRGRPGHPHRLHGPGKPINEYQADGSLIDTFAEGTYPNGVAIDPTPRAAYVATNEKHPGLRPDRDPDAKHAGAGRPGRHQRDPEGPRRPGRRPRNHRMRFRLGTENRWLPSHLPCVPATPIAGPADVSAAVAGLTSGGSYHDGVVAGNADGTTVGNGVELKTPSAPSVSGGFASDLTATSRRPPRPDQPAGRRHDLPLRVRDHHRLRLDRRRSRAAHRQRPTKTQPVMAHLEGLAEPVVYHFQLVATNADRHHGQPRPDLHLLPAAVPELDRPPADRQPVPARLPRLRARLARIRRQRGPRPRLGCPAAVRDQPGPVHLRRDPRRRHRRTEPTSGHRRRQIRGDPDQHRLGDDLPRPAGQRSPGRRSRDANLEHRAFLDFGDQVDFEGKQPEQRPLRLGRRAAIPSAAGRRTRRRSRAATSASQRRLPALARLQPPRLLLEQRRLRPGAGRTDRGAGLGLRLRHRDRDDDR